MFDSKKGITLEDIKGAETIVGASVKLKGNLKSDGDITVNGCVVGEVRTKANVVIGGSAEIKANVVGKNAMISGVVQGNIKVEDELKITETGKIYGDIEAKILNIAPGAIFSGRSIMIEAQPVEENLMEDVLEDEVALKLEA